jgi:trk system potassium uptake protein TrkA
MKIVIAGCGNVGYYLAKTLCERRHRVSVIDDSLDRCRLIGASAFGRKIEITCGDATAERVLRDAGAAGCDAFIAVTGQDQNNLTACMLAKELLCAGRTITRVNNPGNIRVFQQLGVDCVISSAARIADVIEQELDWTDIDAILTARPSTRACASFCWPRARRPRGRPCRPSACPRAPSSSSSCAPTGPSSRTAPRCSPPATSSW